MVKVELKLQSLCVKWLSLIVATMDKTLHKACV